MSHDYDRDSDHNPAMPDRMSETEEKAAFIRRTRQAREARFDSQKPMLTILGVSQGTYKQYETRTPLPHRHIPKFCAACDIDVDWLLTGVGKGPVEKVYPSVVKTRGRKPQRQRAA